MCTKRERHICNSTYHYLNIHVYAHMYICIYVYSCRCIQNNILTKFYIYIYMLAMFPLRCNSIAPSALWLEPTSLTAHNELFVKTTEPPNNYDGPQRRSA